MSAGMARNIRRARTLLSDGPRCACARTTCVTGAAPGRRQLQQLVMADYRPAPKALTPRAYSRSGTRGIQSNVLYGAIKHRLHSSLITSPGGPQFGEHVPREGVCELPGELDVVREFEGFVG